MTDQQPSRQTRAADTVEIVRRRLADGRAIADADVHTLVAEIDRLRAALVGAEIALNRDEDVESARRIIMEANHGKQS